VKGQMEIFGMVFIVLLIFVGFFIYITLGIDPDPNSIGSDYEKTQMATNFIDAILRVTTDCSNQDLGYIIAACEDPLSTMGGLGCANPCEEAQDILVIALQETLGKMEYKYRLTFSAKESTGFVAKFTLPDGVPFICNEKVKPGLFPFQSHLTRNMLEMKLEICR